MDRGDSLYTAAQQLGQTQPILSRGQVGVTWFERVIKRLGSDRNGQELLGHVWAKRPKWSRSALRAA